MAELKTKATDEDVEQYLNKIADKRKREDSFTILRMMKQATKLEPKMWGTMIGFGSYKYQYESGHSGEFFRVGFAPRKQNITLYLYCDIERAKDLLAKLGKHKASKACLYINKLSDVDQGVLRELIEDALKQTPKGEI